MNFDLQKTNDTMTQQAKLRLTKIMLKNIRDLSVDEFTFRDVIVGTKYIHTCIREELDRLVETGFLVKMDKLLGFDPYYTVADEDKLFKELDRLMAMEEV